MSVGVTSAFFALGLLLRVILKLTLMHSFANILILLIFLIFYYNTYFMKCILLKSCELKGWCIG